MALVAGAPHVISGGVRNNVALESLALLALLVAGCSSSTAGDNDLGPTWDLAPVDGPMSDADADLPGPDMANDGTPDASLPLDGFGQISGQCNVLDDAEWKAPSPFLFRNAIDFGTAAFDPAKLTAGGQQIWTEGNRGGSSIHSEIFAHELLHRCELAKLLKTESKITYDVEGKKTDLLLEIDSRKIGVSVTRAYHYPPTTPFTEAEAKTLLDKKLSDLPLSQANATPQDAWVRSMLHVLAYDSQYADAVQAAWKQVDPARGTGYYLPGLRNHWASDRKRALLPHGISTAAEECTFLRRRLVITAGWTTEPVPSPPPLGCGPSSPAPAPRRDRPSSTGRSPIRRTSGCRTRCSGRSARGPRRA